MTKLNNEICELNQDASELSFEELEQISGGFDVFGAIEAVAKEVVHIINGSETLSVGK